MYTILVYIFHIYWSAIDNLRWLDQGHEEPPSHTASMERLRHFWYHEPCVSMCVAFLMTYAENIYYTCVYFDVFWCIFDVFFWIFLDIEICHAFIWWYESKTCCEACQIQLETAFVMRPMSVCQLLWCYYFPIHWGGIVAYSLRLTLSVMMEM